MNPELRATLNQLTSTLDNAGQTVQEQAFTFTQLVIDPCIGGLRSCLVDCTAACFPRARDNRLRARARARSRGQRDDLHFDFYDDWDDDDLDGYGQPATGGRWGTDELDSLLAGQPRRQRGMSYGTVKRRIGRGLGEGESTNIVPSSSYFGFLQRFKWRPGASGQRFRPRAAGLEEHPGANTFPRRRKEQIKPLLEGSDEDDILAEHRKHRRTRSATQSSKSTTNSLSSRGDLIVGDEEEDAKELDDEFANMLQRTSTGMSRRPGMSRKSTRMSSGKSSKSQVSRRSDSSRSIPGKAKGKSQTIVQRSEVEPPSMADMRAEEDRLRQAQDLEIQQKRQAASLLASARGLDVAAPEPKEYTEIEVPEDAIGTILSPVSTNHAYNADSETEPFPSFPTTPVQEYRELDRPP